MAYIITNGSAYCHQTKNRAVQIVEDRSLATLFKDEEAAQRLLGRATKKLKGFEICEAQTEPAEPANLSEQPKADEQPQVTEQPQTDEQPKATEQPQATEKLQVTEQPQAIEQPRADEQPEQPVQNADAAEPEKEAAAPAERTNGRERRSGRNRRRSRSQNRPQQAPAVPQAENTAEETIIAESPAAEAPQASATVQTPEPVPESRPWIETATPQPAIAEAQDDIFREEPRSQRAPRDERSGRRQKGGQSQDQSGYGGRRRGGGSQPRVKAQPVPDANHRRRMFTTQERNLIYNRTEGHCGICGRFIPLEEYTIDHIIPLSKGGTNDLENLQPCCSFCNKAKDDSVGDEFYSRIVRIFLYQARLRYGKKEVKKFKKMIRELEENK